MKFLIRVWICIIGLTVFLYGIIDKQNILTGLQREIPKARKEVRALDEEITRLQYAVDCFESPVKLMELAKRPEYGHLRYPYNNEVLVLIEEPASPPLREEDSPG